MASQCKRLQCTIDRRGFRQELDSWRHKLIHCVGFESILESLLGPQLLEDLKLFKDLEPTTLSDWSFDANCPFCCLRRDKVKEHLHVLSDEWLEDRSKPLSVKDQAAIIRLEEQAEEFLHAVLCRKYVPNFSDAHVPVVAREILQRMIRQFAAEYTSKTSPPQDSLSDQSPPNASSLSGAAPPSSSATTASWPARSHNPVLSKLLMAVQDAPLDLTVKKPSALPGDQDGVLDLSIKKSRCSSGSSLPARSPCLSPAAASLKGESPGLAVSKARELQSTSTLEQFMAKLCVQHQRQIVDAIGFLQSEVKALASSSTLQTGTLGIQGSACSSAKVCAVTPEKCNPKSENQDVSTSIQSSCAVKKDSENVASLKTSATAGPVLDLRSLGLGSNHTSLTNTTSAVDVDNSRHSDHAPLKMKIMASNVADGKKLSCVLNASLSSHSDSLEDREGRSNSSDRTDTARLSSSVKKHSQNHQARQRDIQGHTNETPSKTFSPHMTTPPDCPRTARKTIRTSSDNRSRDSACREMIDPDIGHCDIVFIDKPITECFKQRRRGMLPRRNARKSTRGHMYSEDVWELKTVRTLTGRGNCPTPMPELITLVTPKQVLSKPDGVPPVDMPFAGACRESLIQQMATEESNESVLPGNADMVEVATSEVDVIVETSQTDQSQSKGSPLPPSPIRSQAQNEGSDLRSEAEGEKEPAADSGLNVSEEIVAQCPPNVEESRNPEPNEDVEVTAGQTVAAEAEEQPLNDVTAEDNELPLSDEQQQKSSPSAVDPMDEEENKREETLSEQPEELQAETQISQCLEVTEESDYAGLAEGSVKNEPDSKASEEAEAEMPLVADSDDDYDVSSKTLDALLKELPPWRRKRGTVISLPKRLRQTETVVVGYVNGRPISASDRSLRRRSSNSSTSPVKISSKPSRIPASKTVVDSPVESKVENDNSDNNPPEAVAESPGAASDAQQVTEPSSVAPTSPASKSPSSPASKSPSKDKQMEGHKKVQRGDEPTPPPSDQLVDRSPVTGAKRQLRSTGQRPTPLPAVDVPSPEPAGSTVPLSTDHISPPPSVTSPSVLAPPSTGDEQPQQDIVPETAVESNTEEAPSANADGEEMKKDEDEGRLQAKQKLRSSKAAVEDGKAEHPQQFIDKSSPSENQCQAEAEVPTQGMPLRNKRILRKDVETAEVSALQKTEAATSGDVDMGSDNSVSLSEKPTRMPLRSESNKPETSNQAVAQSPAADGKKLALRSQRLATPSTSTASLAGRKSDVASPVRIKPERTSKAQLRPPSLSASPGASHSSAGRSATQRSEAPKQTTNKFFQTLTGDASQHLITNLNIKFDKMQKGWLQIDKEGQPSAKYKNRADRQAAIWKSKRRAKKAKSLEHQKYSPVQMLFMKGFNLSSICRWFLESTETKSLVIVKKVNTRLPSETQLCFHSSSNSSGTSQGVFPSLQAERLKKHLKKFAIASPVKSNPKSQKLIAKALEQEANAAKGRERREGPAGTQSSSTSHSTKASASTGDCQKSSGKTKIPASARILRKYSNIREKMQVQHTNSRLKDASKSLRSKSINRLAASKSTGKSDARPYLRVQKPPLPVGKPIRESAAKAEQRKTLSDKNPVRNSAEERMRKGQSRVLRDEGKKELAKRHSQRLGSTRMSEQKPPEAPKSKQASEAEKPDVEKPVVEKPAVGKVNAAKVQAKEPAKPAAPETEGAGDAAESPQGTDAKVPSSPDQVLTRSQRKMEAAAPPSESPGPALKKGTKSMHAQSASPKQVRKAEDSALTRSRAASLPRSAAKSATKRTQEPLAVPAKRTRTSLLK
ncbi:uncharacterized protein LOC142883584 isoform X2 [Nelusetta ayraudi]|uniref:uncharacterized protein LOC142883584 isoform X2 n=1 Tax=Nelusetta ayraudi TaxID=303726 RepID=UPI003F6E72BF